MNLHTTTSHEPSDAPMYVETRCPDCDRLKAELAAAMEKINGQEAAFNSRHDEIEQARSEVERLRALICDLSDGEDCEFDHHGGCQSHGYLSLKPGERCPMGEANEIAAGRGEG